ncbi:MAG: M23 family metallopeptidase [Peptococcaceae bacterium]
MKKQVLIIPALLLVVAAGAFAFLYFSNTFNEQNLKTIDIELINDNTGPEGGTQEHFSLSPENKEQLAQALTSGIEGDLHSEEIMYRYNLVLHNTWGFAKQYTVLFTEDAAVLLQDQENLSKVEKPDFFYGHAGFRGIYSDRLAPAVQVTFNKDRVSAGEIEKQWSYLKYDGQWSTQDWGFNEDSEVNGRVTIHSQDDKLQVLTGKAPDHAYLKITDQAGDNKVVFADEVDLNQLPLPDRNGSFSYEVTMTWNDKTKTYQGEAVLSIPVVLDFPEKFLFSKERLIQGDMLEVSVYYAANPEDIFLEQSIFSDFRWYRQDGFMRGYIPTNYSVKPGQYQVTYGNRKKGTEFSQTIEVVAHDYSVQHLTIDGQIEEETRNEAAYDEFARYFTPVRKESAPERYYTEPFILPVKGRLTTEFGQTRYVNGSPTSSRHSGLDLAAPTGTGIQAANRGKVVLSMPLILTGNTIVIDHGEGLFSVYYHLHERFAAAGDIIRRGQEIGTVGTTGFSTGPHLHFTMSYYLMNIEPGFFIVGEPITKANYQEFMNN